MQFDLFHSIGRIDSLEKRLDDRAVFTQFMEQLCLGEDLGFEMIWVAESHFSSEVQKSNPNPVIPNYRGEVGLNCDSPQLFQFIKSKTKKIGFGTAIYNIVGGNGGPIGAADRARSLIFLNHLDAPRNVSFGVASGRFPYINRPYGILPRSELEEKNWKDYQRYILIEALEIFLRLVRGDTVASSDVQSWKIQDQTYVPRWVFDRLRLVPELPKDWEQKTRFVLGTSDPLARDHALKFADCDVFNLSFTPPKQIDQIHEDMFARYQSLGRKWHRSRLPRTVLVFVDQTSKQAHERASKCFDTYIEAMRGTVQLPPKEELMARALIGDPSQIKEQLSEGASHGFHAEDRLMLWFEFNESNGDAIKKQMRLFAEKVAPHYAGGRS